MRTGISLLLLLLALLASPSAYAHAHLDHANPPVGGTVQTAPTEVTLTFTQNLEPAFSSVEVSDASGARVDAGKAQIGGNTMRVPVKSLPAGTYRVHWHAMSVDTHTTEGSFTFTIGR